LHYSNITLRGSSVTQKYAPITYLLSIACNLMHAVFLTQTVYLHPYLLFHLPVQVNTQKSAQSRHRVDSLLARYPSRCPTNSVKALNALLTDIKLGLSAQGRCARILFSSWRLWSLTGTCQGRRPSLDVNHRRSPPCSKNSVRCTHTRLEHLNCSAACSHVQHNLSKVHL